MRPFLLIVSLASLTACGSAGLADPPATGSDVDAAGDSPAPDAVDPEDGSTNVSDGGVKHDGSVKDAAPPADLAPKCTKHLTVVFAVGTGAGAVDSLSNGCWTVIDADGAANHSYRKCSTGNMIVSNP